MPFSKLIIEKSQVFSACSYFLQSNPKMHGGSAGTTVFYILSILSFYSRFEPDNGLIGFQDAWGKCWNYTWVGALCDNTDCVKDISGVLTEKRNMSQSDPITNYRHYHYLQRVSSAQFARTSYSAPAVTASKATST